MSARNLFNERFGMLMACASPGSALACHLGKTISEPGLLERSGKTATAAERSSKARPGTGWLGGLFDRLEQWSWERQMRAQEAYLSNAMDLRDLEARMRQLDNGDGLSRGRALR